MDMDNDSQKRILIIGIIAILVGVIIYNIYKYGVSGIGLVINGIIATLVWISVVGIVLFVLYLLFLWEKKINAPLEVYKDIVKECRISKPDNLRYLWLSGDKDHRSKFIGRIVGYSHRQNFKTVNKKYSYEDVFVVRRSHKGFIGLFTEFFSRAIIVRCPDKMHDELHQDVRINCVSLIKQGMYYYPDTIHLDFDIIDNTLYYESERYIQLKVIEIIAPLIQKAMGIKKEDIKSLEGKTGMELANEMRGGK